MRNISKSFAAALLAALLALPAHASQPVNNGGAASPDMPGSEPVTLSVAVTDTQDTLDPARVTAQGGETVLYHLFENLMRWEDNGEGWAVLAPGQAESYTLDTDYAGNATYTFTLREGLLWSDGKSVKADDFVTAWQRLANPANDLPHRELLSCVSGYGQVQETGDTSLLAVSAPNARTFVVTLDGSHAHFLEEVCGGAYTMPVRADLAVSDGWGKTASATITNGPYTAAYLSRNQVTLERSETYYNSEAILPDVIQFTTRTGSSADYQKLLGGELALVTDLPEEPLQALADSGLWTPEPVTATYGVLLNTRQPPFDDSNVRQAFRLVIDSQALAEALNSPAVRSVPGLVPYGVSDYGERVLPAQPADEGTALPDPNAGPPAAEPAAVFWDFRAHSLEKVTAHGGQDYAADCARAKALLAQAGYAGGGGFPIVEYLYVESSWGRELASVLRRMWQDQLGVAVITRGVSQEEYDALVQMQAISDEAMEDGAVARQVEDLPAATGEFTMAGQAFTVPYSDAGVLLDRWYSKSEDNVSGYASDAFDILLDAARAAVSPEARDAYLHDAEAILLEDAPVIPVCCQGGSFQLAEGLSGLYRAPDGVYFLYGVA